MIFTRVDCGLPPFGDNPSLDGCASDGFGLRRSARAVSKQWGGGAGAAGANWSVAEQCSHGVAGEEQYTLNPWRDPSWRPGLWLGLASFLHIATGNVTNQLLVSSDHGANWSHVMPPGTQVCKSNISLLFQLSLILFCSKQPAICQDRLGTGISMRNVEATICVVLVYSPWSAGCV
jgi:hypothetical protein